MIGLIAVIVLMPFTVKFAWRIGAIDVPKDFRRMHRRSIPRNGGMAIILGLLIGCALLERSAFSNRLLICGTAVFLVGLLDDVYSLSPWIKLSVQLFATVGIVLEAPGIYGISSAGAAFWVLALTNAHNFIDGLDGLFAGAAIMEAIGLGVLLLLQQDATIAQLAFLMAGTCFGFRLFNRQPARIFAGDCGSGSVGFLLGGLSLRLFENPTPATGVGVCLLFAYPLADLTTAVLRRILRGKSPFSADRGHLHHRICDAGVSKSQCVSILLSITLGFCTLAVLIGAFQLYELASLGCFLMAFLLIAIRYRITANRKENTA